MKTNGSVTLSFSVKKKDGFIADERMTFVSMQKAYEYMNRLKNTCLLVGKPILESRPK